MRKKTKDVKAVVARYEYGGSYEELEAEMNQLDEDIKIVDRQIEEGYIWRTVIRDRVKYLQSIVDEEAENGIGDEGADRVSASMDCIMCGDDHCTQCSFEDYKDEIVYLCHSCGDGLEYGDFNE